MSAICKHSDIRRKQHGVRIAALFLCVLLLMLCPGCGGKQRYSVTYADVFDTVTTFTAYTESRAEFDALAEQLHAQLLEDHRRSDIYHEYPGLVNLCTLNKRAGEEAVQVDGELMDLLQFGARWHELTGGKLNIAMGAVLALWQEARETAAADPDSAQLPDEGRLREAAAHCSMADLALDTESGTVRYLDPELKLDVGAVAKGWAQSRAMELLDRARCTSWLLNMGGSVSCRGTKPDGSPWTIGLEDPLDKSLPMRTFLRPPRSGRSLSWCGQWDSNPQAGALAPKTSVFASFTMPAAFFFSRGIIAEASGKGKGHFRFFAPISTQVGRKPQFRATFREW